MKTKQLWFRRKIYGWGWYPVSWQGWLVILIWVIMFSLILVQLNQDWKKEFVFVLISVAVLLWICYKTGEKPRWQWGRK